MVPAPKNRQVQVIDVRDLADWTLRLVEQQVTGTFNAIGEETTFGQLMDAGYTYLCAFKST